MRSLHRILALGFGFPLLWMATTGIFLEIAQIRRADTYPYRLAVPRSDPATVRSDPSSVLDEVEAIARLMDQAAREGRSDGVNGIVFSPSNADSERILFRNGETWFADPRTHQVFARESGKRWDAVAILISLHRGKFLGFWGRILFSVLALSGALLSMTGLWLFRIRRHFRSVRDFHRIAAGAIGIPLIITLVSGSIWNLSQELRGRKYPVAHSPLSTQDWIEAIHSASKAYSSRRPDGIYRDPGSLLVVFRDFTRVYLTPGSPPEATQISRPWSAPGWLEGLFPLHSGRIWGPSGGGAPLLVGLATLALAFSGAALFMRRRSPSFSRGTRDRAVQPFRASQPK